MKNAAPEHLKNASALVQKRLSENSMSNFKTERQYRPECDSHLFKEMELMR